MKEKNNEGIIATRIKYALGLRGMNQADLVEKTRIPKGSISQYATGYVEPKSDRIYLMAKALSVDPVWLMGFDVPMERSEKMQKLIESKTKEAMLQSISEDEMAFRIALSLTKLSDYDKNMVAVLVSGLLQKQTEPKQQQ